MGSGLLDHGAQISRRAALGAVGAGALATGALISSALDTANIYLKADGQSRNADVLVG